MRPIPKLTLLALLLLGCVAASGRKVVYEGVGDEPVVVVDEPGGGRTLRFGRNGAIQTAAIPGHPERLVLEYTKGAMVGLAFVPEPRSVLFIGVGGGSMPAYLHHHFPGARIDAVDIDPEVLSVARKYFDLPEDERLVTHAADGRRFLERTERRYDLIFLDAYGADSVPRHLATREFLALVRKRLAPGGVVVGNLWDAPANDLYDAMVRAYQVEFDRVWVLEAAGNRLVVGVPGDGPDRAALLANAKTASSGRELGLDLVRMAAAIKDITRPSLDAEPLADRVPVSPVTAPSSESAPPPADLKENR